MRALLRYLFASGLLVALAWGTFGLEVGGRSIFGHLRTLNSKRFDSVMAQVKADLERRLASEAVDEEAPPKKKTKKTKRAKTTAPPAKPQAQQDGQVARLRATASRVEPKRAPRPRATRTTGVDERISAEDHKALDDLLSARVQRLR